jgi:hypothetical protein
MKLQRVLIGFAVLSIPAPALADDTKDYIGSQCDMIWTGGYKSLHLLTNLSGVSDWFSCPGISDTAYGFYHVTIDVSQTISNVHLTFRDVNAGTLYGYDWTSTTNLGGGKVRYNFHTEGWFAGPVNPFAIEGILPPNASIYRYASMEFDE